MAFSFCYEIVRASDFNDNFMRQQHIQKMPDIRAHVSVLFLMIFCDNCQKHRTNCRSAKVET